MIYQNMEHEKIFPSINWENKQIGFCNKIITKLTDKEQLFLYNYYWMGKTEEEIAVLLEYKSQQAVSVFMNRIFAKMRMFADLEQIFLPKCLSITLRKQHPGFYKSFRQLLDPLYFDHIIANKKTKYLMEPTINFLIEYIDEIQAKNCKETCLYHHTCFLHRSQFVSPLSEHYRKDRINYRHNLRLIKKILSYLLNWKVYHESH